MTTVLIGKNGLDWSTNMTFSNAVVFWKNRVQLLNGYYPSNFPNIISGGSDVLVTNSAYKMGIKFIAPTSKTIKLVAIVVGGYPTSGSIFRIGIQGHNQQNDSPNNVFIDSGLITNYINEAWELVDLPNGVPITEGEPYWIVIEYVSGTDPPKFGTYASGPCTVDKDGLQFDINITNHRVPISCNYNGDLSVNDDGYVDVKAYNGISWSYGSADASYTTFFVKFDDGTFYGQPYRHNYATLTSTYTGYGQYFDNNGQEKVVTRIDAPWNVTGGSLNNRPTDNLYYHIREGSPTGTEISNGIFLTPTEVYIYDGPSRGTGGGAAGAWDRRWYVKNITPVTLKSNQRYFIYFDSTNNTGSSWQTDILYTYYNYSQSVGQYCRIRCPEVTQALEELTYGKFGVSAYRRNSSGSWTTIISGCCNHDMSFRMKLQDIYNGTIESNLINTGSEETWKSVSINADIKIGTSVDIEILNNGIFIPIINNVQTEILYYIPDNMQSSDITFRLILKTNNSKISPIINNVILSTESTTCPTPICNISITQI